MPGMTQSLNCIKLLKTMHANNKLLSFLNQWDKQTMASYI